MKAISGRGGGTKRKMALPLCTQTAAKRIFDVPGPTYHTGNAQHSWSFLITSFGVPQVLKSETKHKIAPRPIDCLCLRVWGPRSQLKSLKAGEKLFDPAQHFPNTVFPSTATSPRNTESLLQLFTPMEQRIQNPGKHKTCFHVALECTAYAAA